MDDCVIALFLLAICLALDRRTFFLDDEDERGCQGVGESGGVTLRGDGDVIG